MISDENPKPCRHELVIRSQDANLLTYRYYWRINFPLKPPKTSILAVRAHFLLFAKIKKTTPDFFDEKSKTGLDFEIGQPQRKCQLMTTLQSMANPAMSFTKLHSKSSTLIKFHKTALQLN